VIKFLTFRSFPFKFFDHDAWEKNCSIVFILHQFFCMVLSMGPRDAVRAEPELGLLTLPCGVQQRDRLRPRWRATLLPLRRRLRTSPSSSSSSLRPSTDEAPDDEQDRLQDLVLVDFDCDFPDFVEYALV